MSAPEYSGARVSKCGCELITHQIGVVLSRGQNRMNGHIFSVKLHLPCPVSTLDRGGVVFSSNV